MPNRLLSRVILLVAAISLLACAAYAQQKAKGKPLSQKELDELSRKATIRPPSGADFYISPIAEIPGRYSLLLTDSNNQHVTETFSEDQLAVLEAILVEARKFAQTEESVGTTKPVITRFYDKREPAFMVDVAKLRDRSQFFLTIKSLTGHLTVDVGTVRRGEEKASPLLYTILSRVQSRNARAK